MQPDQKHPSFEFIADAYSYKALAVHPLNKEMMKPSSNIKLHMDNESNIISGLQEGRVILALCPILHLLKDSNLEPGIPVGVSYNGCSPNLYFGLKTKNPELIEHINKRTRFLEKAFKKVKENSSYKTPREVVRDFWLEVNTSHEISSNTSLRFQPRLRYKNCSSDTKELALMFFRMLFGKKMVKHQELMDNTMMDVIESNDEYVIEVLSGDKAFSCRDRFDYILEFGKLWHQVTKLPFVTKIWQKASLAPSSALKSKMIHLAELAQAKMKIDPSDYYSNMELENSAYNEKQISNLWKDVSFVLGETEFLSLQTMLQLYIVFREKSNRTFHLKSEKWNYRELHRTTIL